MLNPTSKTAISGYVTVLGSICVTAAMLMRAHFASEVLSATLIIAAGAVLTMLARTWWRQPVLTSGKWNTEIPDRGFVSPAASEPGASNANGQTTDQDCFRATFDQAAVGLAHLDPSGGCVEVNERLCRILGYSPTELRKMSFADIVHSDDRQAVRTGIQDLFGARTRTYSAETRILRSDGSTAFVNVTASPVRGRAEDSPYLVTVVQDISAHRESERKLRKSERELRTVLETLPVGVLFTDELGRVMMSNHAAEKLWGRITPGNGNHFRHVRVADADSGRSIPYSEQALTKALEYGETSLGEVVQIDIGDGLGKTIYNSAVPIRDDVGKIVSAVLVSQDITESRQGESALREAAERLRLTTATVGIGNWEWDISSGRMIWSEEQYRIFGIVNGSPVTLRVWIDAVYPDDRMRVQSELQSAPDHLQPLDLEYRIIQGDDCRWINTKGKAFCLPDGRPTRMVGVVTDITEQKRAREDLQVLAALVESSEDAIVGQTPEGIVLSWNRGAEAMFGYRADEVIGTRIATLASPDADETEEDNARIFRGERVIHRETIRRRKNGEAIFVSLTISPIRANTGEVIGISEVARDITARKFAEQQIKTLNEELEIRVERRTAQLEEANRMLQSFAFTVSHDLRAPLRTIRGLTQALVEDCGDMLDSNGKEYATRIADNAVRMDALIRDLLEYSRLSRSEMLATRLSLESAVMEAVEMQTAEAVGLNHPELRSPEIEVITPLHDVMGHQSTVVRMLTNLIGNAIKFVHPDVRPVVTISSESRGQRVRVWVQDNGIGIDPSHHARIFDAFERLHEPSEFPGTGIGLAIVRKGAERMGGEAGLESSLGAGSRFWFELKAVPSSETTKC